MYNTNCRTDLALEINEGIDKEDGRYRGVVVNEHTDSDTGIKVTDISIINEHGEKVLGRPVGKYITIEADELSYAGESYKKSLSELLTGYIKQLCKEKTGSGKTVLIVGLGNRAVTADSLGPDVVDRLTVNRHTNDNAAENMSIAAICPGVMAQTGMETAKIVKGVVEQIKPDVVIAIDALAARNSNRLNSTIQLSDKGINPGSGVGNHRVGITSDNIGVPVIAIGVPTVIDAPTIVYDALDTFLQVLSGVEGLENISDIFRYYTEEEKYRLASEVVPASMAGMYVTSKDIDSDVKCISDIIASAVNALCTV